MCWSVKTPNGKEDVGNEFEGRVQLVRSHWWLLEFHNSGGLVVGFMIKLSFKIFPIDLQGPLKKTTAVISHVVLLVKRN